MDDTERDEAAPRAGTPEGQTRGRTRQDRLKAALRDNLRRRKAQARGRAEDDASEEEALPPHDATDPEPPGPR